MKKEQIGEAVIMLIITIILASTICTAQNTGSDIMLKPSPDSLAKSLYYTLKNRHSSRDFAEHEVSLKDLSTILWAANGVNRATGRRTAPAPYGKNVVAIYVATKKAAYLYQPEHQRLKFVSYEVLNHRIGTQEDIQKASDVLILVGRIREYPPIVSTNERIQMAHATAGCIAQNVYLAANALKLGTRLVEWINVKEIKRGLDLKDDEIPLYIMPLGYAKE
ncbi:MAG TPA: nitroreductase family protein [Bacillota bacterium]|nr:nitroreductase family protein [Bacillota bacterium]